MQIMVTVDASNRGTDKAPKCHLQWKVSGKSAGHSKVLFRHAENPKYSENAVELGGTSTDGTKILLDFFSAAGDYTDHRPAVYDFTTGTWQIRDVADRVTRSLPKCDYLTMLQGVTDSGDVILYSQEHLQERLSRSKRMVAEYEGRHDHTRRQEERCTLKLLGFLSSLLFLPANFCAVQTHSQNVR